MGQKVKPKNANIPWVVSFEFPSFADAKVFAEMAEEEFGDKALLRKKNSVFIQGAFAKWRTTRAVRQALSGRSFTYEMLGEALANSGYAGTRSSANSWLVRALAEGVIIRLERGVFEFPRQAPLAAGTRCQACKPANHDL